MSIKAVDARSLKTLSAKMSKLGVMTEKSVQDAAWTVGKAIHHDAKTSALFVDGSGALRDNIRIEKNKHGGVRVFVWAHPTRGAPHAHLVHDGHLVRQEENGPILGFAPPLPFMTDAWNANYKTGVRELRKEVNAAVKRAKKGGPK